MAASKKLLEMLNQAIAREMAVSIQYMWQHVTIKGYYAENVGPVLRTIALAEMLHAELIAERLDYLGGEPTTKPMAIEVGGGKLPKMLQIDIKAEADAIKFYKQIIKQADKEDDVTTRKLFEQILGEEEGHHKIFTNLMDNK